MKKNLIAIVILLVAGMALPAHAQESNVSLQPEWGPSGYDYVKYYYIPEIEVYYNIRHKEFTYLQNGEWVTSSYLPARYEDFDLYSAYKAVVNDSHPWYMHDVFRDRYYRFRDIHDQLLRVGYNAHYLGLHHDVIRHVTEHALPHHSDFIRHVGHGGVNIARHFRLR